MFSHLFGGRYDMSQNYLRGKQYAIDHFTGKDAETIEWEIKRAELGIRDGQPEAREFLTGKCDALYLLADSVKPVPQPPASYAAYQAAVFASDESFAAAYDLTHAMTADAIRAAADACRSHGIAFVQVNTWTCSDDCGRVDPVYDYRPVAEYAEQRIAKLFPAVPTAEYAEIRPDCVAAYVTMPDGSRDAAAFVSREAAEAHAAKCGVPVPSCPVEEPARELTYREDRPTGAFVYVGSQYAGMVTAFGADRWRYKLPAGSRWHEGIDFPCKDAAAYALATTQGYAVAGTAFDPYRDTPAEEPTPRRKRWTEAADPTDCDYGIPDDAPLLIPGQVPDTTDDTPTDPALLRASLVASSGTHDRLAAVCGGAHDDPAIGDRVHYGCTVPAGDVFGTVVDVSSPGGVAAFAWARVRWDADGAETWVLLDSLTVVRSHSDADILSRPESEPVECGERYQCGACHGSGVSTGAGSCGVRGGDNPTGLYERPFVAYADHGDYPAPGQVMVWDQWDDKPLVVVNNDGTHIAAIQAGEYDNAGDAKRGARALLKEWTDAVSELAYLKTEVSALVEEIDAAKRLGHQDRVEECIDRIARLI